MKKQVLGLSLLASLVMGMTGVAHAVDEPSKSATVTFTGSVNKGSCDVDLNGSDLVQIGDFLSSSFPNPGTVLGGQTVTLDFGNCKGDEITGGSSLLLKAHAPSNNSSLTSKGLFGDASTNYVDVGVKLTAKTEGKDTETPLLPEGEVAIFTPEKDTAAASATVDPAFITAALQSTVAKPASGDIKSTVIFSAVYP